MTVSPTYNEAAFSAIDPPFAAPPGTNKALERSTEEIISRASDAIPRIGPRVTGSPSPACIANSDKFAPIVDIDVKVPAPPPIRTLMTRPSTPALSSTCPTNCRYFPKSFTLCQNFTQSLLVAASAKFLAIETTSSFDPALSSTSKPAGAGMVAIVIQPLMSGLSMSETSRKNEPRGMSKTEENKSVSSSDFCLILGSWPVVLCYIHLKGLHSSEVLWSDPDYQIQICMPCKQRLPVQ